MWTLLLKLVSDWKIWIIVMLIAALGYAFIEVRIAEKKVLNLTNTVMEQNIRINELYTEKRQCLDAKEICLNNTNTLNTRVRALQDQVNATMVIMKKWEGKYWSLLKKCNIGNNVPVTEGVLDEETNSDVIDFFNGVFSN